MRYYERVAPLMLPHLRDRPVARCALPTAWAASSSSSAMATRCGSTVSMFWMPACGRDIRDCWRSSRHRRWWRLHSSTRSSSTHGMPANAVSASPTVSSSTGSRQGLVLAHMREGAAMVKALLDELGLVSFLKTSGGKGLHVVVPVTPRAGWDEVKDFAHAVVLHIAQLIPQRFVAKRGAERRVGKIFIDYLRNGIGATTVAASRCVRARSGPVDTCRLGRTGIVGERRGVERFQLWAPAGSAGIS